MLRFLATLPTFENDRIVRTVWEWIRERFQEVEGVCYYKHPVVVTTTGIMPDLAIFTRSFQPVVVKCIAVQIEHLSLFDEEVWEADGQEPEESPILQLEDFVVGLKSRFDQDRTLRHRILPRAVIAFPLVSKHQFETKFGNILGDTPVIWSDRNLDSAVIELEPVLTDEEWRRTRSVAQGVAPLKKPSSRVPNSTTTLSDAIIQLDKEIALLDIEQEQAALQIAPGPQSIKGLAGTGKTVLLALKAAKIHFHYPSKKILYTFWTQSLYNHSKDLISRFYRAYAPTDPNWDVLHIRHAWGGSTRAGVYSDLCGRQGIVPMALDDARKVDYQQPFRVCCNSALSRQIQPDYDYILLDEAQDFPGEFFQLLYKLSWDPHCIYFAYDELQDIFQTKDDAKPENNFGLDKSGNPIVNLDEGVYPAEMEKKLVLRRSYRCPPRVLMLAHALGLGLYNQHGCIQMLESAESWENIGYKVEQGNLSKGEQVIIVRPEENSPNSIEAIYAGKQHLIDTQVFESADAELDWVAQSIVGTVREEGVAPERIIVIGPDAVRAKMSFPALQRRLVDQNIGSTIPGLVDNTSAFAESGKVTLSNVFRAKGNEAYVVYVINFDFLYDYVDYIENRNRAFTAISRSKAWVRITGVGKKMQQAKNEIDSIMADYPRFKFKFPDMQMIRRLDAETEKRRREVSEVQESLANVTKKAKREALLAAIAKDPSLAQELEQILDEVKRENQ